MSCHVASDQHETSTLYLLLPSSHNLSLFLSRVKLCYGVVATVTFTSHLPDARAADLFICSALHLYATRAQFSTCSARLIMHGKTPPMTCPVQSRFFCGFVEEKNIVGCVFLLRAVHAST